MTKKTIDEKLDIALGFAEDYVADTHSEELIISTRKQRGLAPRTEVHSNPENRNVDLEADYSFARSNLYNLIERGNDTLEGILELAKEMEHPRAYEVASGLIKTLSDTTGELLKLQQQIKAVSETSPQAEGDNVTNQNLFVGSTAELQKLIQDSKKGTH